MFFGRLLHTRSAMPVVPLSAVVLCLLYVVSSLALGGAASAGADNAADQGLADFFKTTYKSSGPVDFVVWRSIAVPVFTAADTLRVFAERFTGEPLWGATSSFLAAIFSLDRVPLEKFVFEYEFGWNELANSNAVFFTEPLQISTGMEWCCFRWSSAGRWLSDHLAFKALWMNYCFMLYAGGLIGTLLSNGYSLIFFLPLFCSLRMTREPIRPLARPSVAQT
jgi:hypothetical protein